MNYKRYKIILYLIAITIVATITVQLYWNYRSYIGNKHRIYNEVQRALDKSVEDYYANITRGRFITFSSPDSLLHLEQDTVFLDKPFRRDMKQKIDSTLQKIIASDSSKAIFLQPKGNRFPQFFNMEKRAKSIDSLMSKVYISISRDTFNLEKLDYILCENLKRRRLDFNYGLSFKSQDYYTGDKTQKYYLERLVDEKTFKQSFGKRAIKSKAKSNYMSRSAKLNIHYKDISLIAFRKTLSGIIISLILSLCVITSLIYLLRVIKNQKQVAEIKDDLISNITHELKTPITTISAAIQALEAFSAIDDKEKTKKYLKVSNDQVEKLNKMVEKILETATLDSDKLVLQKEKQDIISIVSEIIDKYQMNGSGKNFSFDTNTEPIELAIDAFHLENAINNIVDNAVKYGGDSIRISIQEKENSVVINCKDNGNGIDKKSRDKIFDKFYRIPTGNIHNVKGFGIGLYYTKHIIEKHGGTIVVDSEKEKHTIFTITLPKHD